MCGLLPPDVSLRKFQIYHLSTLSLTYSRILITTVCLSVLIFKQSLTSSSLPVKVRPEIFYSDFRKVPLNILECHLTLGMCYSIFREVTTRKSSLRSISESVLRIRYQLEIWCHSLCRNSILYNLDPTSRPRE